MNMLKSLETLESFVTKSPSVREAHVADANEKISFLSKKAKIVKIVMAIISLIPSYYILINFWDVISGDISIKSLVLLVSAIVVGAVILMWTGSKIDRINEKKAELKNYIWNCKRPNLAKEEVSFIIQVCQKCEMADKWRLYRITEEGNLVNADLMIMNAMYKLYSESDYLESKRKLEEKMPLFENL